MSTSPQERTTFVFASEESLPPVTANNQEKELASRVSDGIEVSLLWDEATDSVRVVTYDSKTEEQFSMGVPPEDAMDAFRHPFGYHANQVNKDTGRIALSDSLDQAA